MTSSDIHTNAINHNAMKTFKFSDLMKAILAFMFLCFTSLFLNAQFQTPNPNSPSTQSGEEVRSLSVVTYDLIATHVPGELYRWVVRGGTITAGGTVTSSGDSSIVEWTANAFTITVDWDTDISATPVGSAAGEVIVQKRTGSGCPSQLQILPINMWNNPTANLLNPNIAICSGENLGGSVTINLTGAPDPSANGFQVTYNIVAANLTDLGGNPLGVTGATVVSNSGTAVIPLPDGLVNTTLVDATFTITLTDMHDDFTGSGTLVDNTYVITVHPTPETGDINSSSSLVRR